MYGPALTPPRESPLTPPPPPQRPRRGRRPPRRTAPRRAPRVRCTPYPRRPAAWTCARGRRAGSRRPRSLRDMWVGCVVLWGGLSDTEPRSRPREGGGTPDAIWDEYRDGGRRPRRLHAAHAPVPRERFMTIVCCMVVVWVWACVSTQSGRPELRRPRGGGCHPRELAVPPTTLARTLWHAAHLRVPHAQHGHAGDGRRGVIEGRGVHRVVRADDCSVRAMG